jgi:hypothetical protein
MRTISDWRCCGLNRRIHEIGKKAAQRKGVTQMAWESRKGQGAYYTRSSRIGGRVVREYIGTGRFAQSIALADELERHDRQAAADARREERARLDALDVKVVELDEFADLLARAVLVGAGYH